MHRTAIFLACCALAVAGALPAAPAPFPEPSVVWTVGWEKPVNPLGDWRFDRRGDTMTVTVPGKEDRINSPHLLREVEGDFVVHVRVGGTFRPTGRSGVHRAGIILIAPGTRVRFERCARRESGATLR